MAKEEVIINIKANSSEANKSLEKVTKNTKETSNAANEAAGNFRIMGVSLNGVKSAFSKIIPVAKGMFSTIKAGMISTGIGALVIAVASLISYFTKTKKGAEMLTVGFKAVGAIISVLTDRISAIGGAIVKVFKGDFKGALNEAKGAVTGLGTEIANETRAMIELTETLQRVRDAERDFSKERAQTNQIISEARMLAEDETKSYDERLTALKTANELEITTTEKAIALHQEKLDAKRIEVEMSESMAEDLDELAQLEVELINLQTGSFNTRKRLMTGEETLRREQEANRNARHKQHLADIAEKAKAEEKAAERIKDVQNEIRLFEEKNAEERALLQNEINMNKALDAEESLAVQMDITKLFFLKEDEIRAFYREKAFADAEAFNQQIFAEEEKAAAKKKQLTLDQQALDKSVANSKMQVAGDALGAISDIYGRESAAGQAAAVAQATINTYQAATNALANTPAPPPFPMIAAGVAVAAGLANVNKIIAVEPTNGFATGGVVGGGGSGTSDSVSARLSRGESVINANSTRMYRPLLSAINEAGGGRRFADGGIVEGDTGGMTAGVVKAYVVADDMSNAQDRLAKIRRKSTI